MKSTGHLRSCREFTLITETPTGVVEHLLGAVPTTGGSMIVHLGSRSLRGEAGDLLVPQIREAYDLAHWAANNEDVFEGRVRAGSAAE
jgi:hypothetical protein